MNPLLKKTIILWIFENDKTWQLNNATTEQFRAYIYDDSGNYLIGGEEVSEFIKDFLKIYQK